jgi:hypothetical protein
MHFHDLASADVAAVSGTDIIQIEPSAVPGNATIDKVLTVQGDPTVGPTSLPLLSSLTLGASKVVLNNLNLSSVNIDNGQVGETVMNSLVANVTESSGQLVNGGNVISGNTISGQVALGNPVSAGPAANGDLVTNNTFTFASLGGIPFNVGALDLEQDNNTLVQNNTLRTPFLLGTGIVLNDSRGVSILNNNIIMPPPGYLAYAIVVNALSAPTTVTISCNIISINKAGYAIATFQRSGQKLSVGIANNNLVQNAEGLLITGDSSGSGSDFGTVDVGGGALGSLGGNDFHGYSGMGGNFAVATFNFVTTTTASISALDNIFSGPAGSTVNAGQGSINVSAALDANHAFANRLYNNFLKRGGSTAPGGELDSWASQLPSRGQTAVASGIIRSIESYTRLVDSLYLKILGRPADSTGEAYWVSQLRGGATMEQIISGFLGSTEYAARAGTLALAPGSSDVNYIQSLYTLLLGRTASGGEVTYWLGQLAASNRSAVAMGFLGSAEFRSDFVTALYTPYSPFPASSFVGIVPTLLNRSRAPMLAEIAGWVNARQDLLAIEVSIAASSEFFTNG